MTLTLVRRLVHHRIDLVIAALIFSLALTIFLVSPIVQFSDSQYTFVLSESLLRHRSFALDRFALPHLEPLNNGLYVRNGHIYQQEWSNGHLYYHYPPGSSVLSIPYVVVMRLFGLSSVNPDGTYNLDNEIELQRIFAALLMALTAIVFYFTARLLLPRTWSAVVALGAALGTPVWSTLSRGVWSDTWAVALLSLVVLLLLADATRRFALNPWLFATLLSWTYFVRPTNALAIIAITVYVVACRREIFLRYAGTGLLWFVGFVIYSRSHFGTWLPSYYRNRLTFEHFPEALAGNLISPARGLFVYVPVLLFIAYLLVRYRRSLLYPRLVWLGSASCVLHWLTISAWPAWWGGYSYGPRLMSGLVPWFVLLTILGIEAMRRAARGLQYRWRRPLEIAFGVVLILISTGMNGLGAVDVMTNVWNEKPASVDRHQSRLWSWSYPQFLAGFLRPPLPDYFPPTDIHVEFFTDAAEPYLWYGWNQKEPEFRWTMGREASVVFRADEIADATLVLKAAPFLVAGKLDQQRVVIRLNQHPIQTFTLTRPEAQELSVPLTKEKLQTNNTLVLELPDARTPKSLGLNRDPRALAIAVFWLEIRTPYEPKNTGSKTVSLSALPRGGYHAQIEAQNPPTQMRPGEKHNLRVRVKNTSTAVWLSESQPDATFKVQLGNHWLSAGQLVQTDDGRAALPFDIRPGTEIELSLPVTAPIAPGDYILELDMVQERVTWFAYEGSIPQQIKIKVY